MDLAIDARGLVKRYGDRAALDGFDLQVPTGTVCGLLGPNGAGKTTAVRILTTLLRSDGGRAAVAGIDVAADPAEVRRRIGLSGQEPAVDELLTGRQNLAIFGRLHGLSRSAARTRADELLERFGLSDTAGKSVKHYSGGMRRRLDLAVTFLQAPAVLFLDEPTTGLDPRNRNEVWTALRELVDGGTTVLLTTQYLDEADQLADRIVVLDTGRVIAEGSPEVLKRQVGGDRVEVAVGEDQLDAARSALVGIGLRSESTGSGRLAASLTDDGPGIAHVVRALDEARVEIVDLGLRRATLDDVFLQLTGRSTQPDEPASDEEVAA